MKILVTGATGKVGSRLAKRLAERGDGIRALVRDPARTADLREVGVELAAGDLLDVDSLVAAVGGVDAVVHCAAFFRGATPEQAHAVNDLGTRHLASVARAASVKRFVFTSTGLVYGSNGGRVAREDDPCAPTAAYPVSKLAAERFLLGIEGLDVRVLRLPFVYGDGDPHIEEAIPLLSGFPPAQRMSIAHHVGRPSPGCWMPCRLRTASTTWSTTSPPRSPPCSRPWGRRHLDAVRASAFDALLDGSRIRSDRSFKPRFPRLADAVAAGA
ncbi:NAD-dependent epimerase/dehydratase [Anaeromyxobacter sp. K]|uniref:NAD-dependent epimerase/dehydratase family protein n=1 Tax=Anaeromyxobacter sp. (strain K) TaxID=447217 RepID=UPI00015F9114|nr:NAD-dependent epimerase/dehydratase family protein [Anaeromyxobacter sp. K]ACG72780.1 NAD-dependent epimerase/dehydratase [Anaeromyxobacter sp. K]